MSFSCLSRLPQREGNRSLRTFLLLSSTVVASYLSHQDSCTLLTRQTRPLPDHTRTASNKENHLNTMRKTRDELNPGLLLLPLQLRLEVYSYLISPCLLEGFTHNIGGLYLSCRQIHTEMEAEHLCKLRPVLMAKHGWERIVHYVPVLRVHVDTIKATHLTNANMTLRIPILAPWLKE